MEAAPHGDRRSPRRRPTRWSIVVAVAVAIVALTTALPSSPSSAQSGGGSSTTTSTVRAATPASPSGRIAYATSDGRVWVGSGSAVPVEVGQGAAIGRGDQSAVALAPTGDVVAFIRSDRSVVIVSATGGPPTVVATDAALETLGIESLLAWSSGGERLAYIGVGTAAMVEPRTPDGQRTVTDGSFLSPLPQGVLGNVVEIVDRTGKQTARIGDPSQRNYIGIAASPVDDIMFLQSTIPGSPRRYTLVVGSFGGAAEIPTLFSLDHPVFGPDGTYFVGVGPAKGQQELIRVSTATLVRDTLATSERICSPMPSPDGSRVAFAGGPRCDRLQLVPSGGGQVVDVTPDRTPDTVSFDAGVLGWTEEGRYITSPACRLEAGRLTCGGPSRFLDPDTSKLVDGPVASTVVPARVPLVQSAYLDVDFRGPLSVQRSFVLDVATQATLTQVGEDGRITGRLSENGAELDLDLKGAANQPYVVGRATLRDPAGGVDRTFTILGKVSAVGLRVFGIAGIWMTTDEVPFASGKFNIAVRRR